MGTIVGMKKIKDRQLLFEVLVDLSEALHLKGHTENVFLISQNISGVPARISLRGKNEATKYFLIPKCLRSDFNLHYYNSSVSCQKIKLPLTTMFIYTVHPVQSLKSQIEFDMGTVSIESIPQ